LIAEPRKASALEFGIAAIRGKPLARESVHPGRTEELQSCFGIVDVLRDTGRFVGLPPV